uniref:Protein-glutamate methylesterase/protein-glutamine glutaminase n=1 Tax=candidate division WOR-3 bacterium TaxID=2052148 RepID=A0A7C4XDZ7_UNCW3
MKKRILVVEDSILMQKVIGDIIKESEEFEVCGFARSVNEGWAKFNKLNPEIVTLDYELPGENGLVLLKKIMETKPTPVVMISAHTREGADLTIESLKMGAIDFFTKPSGPISLDLYNYKAELLNKLNLAGRANLPLSEKPPVIKKITKNLDYYIGIGSSTGGVRALNRLIPSFPKDSGVRIIVVQHMPKFFTASLAFHLDEQSSLKVKEADDNDEITPNQVLIAPGGLHIRVDRSGARVELSDEPPRHGVKPSADVLFESMAEVYREKAIGLVLSGMGHDGTQGLSRIKECGGLVIAQDPKEAPIAGMPQSAIDAGIVDFVLPVAEIPGKIMELSKDD